MPDAAYNSKNDYPPPPFYPVPLHKQRDTYFAMSQTFRWMAGRFCISTTGILAAFSCVYSWAQPSLPAPGFTWSEVRFPASAQPEDRDNTIIEGAAEQGIDFLRVFEKTNLNIFSKLDYTLDSEQFDHNNKLKVGAGIKFVSQLSASSTLAIGAKYEVDRRLSVDRSLEGHQLFANWYGSWRLPCKACRGDHPSKPLSMPGVSWGELRYPGSQVAEETHDLILEGNIEQGIDWREIAGWGTLNTYIDLGYVVDSKRYDWNNAIKLGLGAKLKKRVGNGLLQVGAKFVQDKRWIVERTDETILVFVNWSAWWNPNAARLDMPKK